MRHKILTLAVICSLLTLTIFNTTQAQDATGDLLARINNLRGSLGLPAYTLNGALGAAAQNQASWMASTGQVTHQQADGSTPSVRAQRAGYPSSAVSENIYMGGLATVDTAWQFWLNSAVHYNGLTNAVYSEVGIGVASGEHGTAYVLVFGSPTGWEINWPAAPANTGTGATGSGSSANDTTGNASARNAAAPSFIVGVDNFGNIMHEIQAGQTLGEIALIYGYTWDDLEYIRAVNTLTELEGRQLSIGGILLIPPFDAEREAVIHNVTTQERQAAPPTDSPGAIEPETTPTPDNLMSVGEILAQMGTPTRGAVPLLAPTMTTTPTLPATLIPPQSISADDLLTMTPPTATAVVIAAAQESDNADNNTIQAEPTLINVQTVTIRESNFPSWLIIGVIVQIVLLGAAGLEFLRRSMR